MLDPIIDLVKGIQTGMTGPLFLPLMAVALGICGFIFMLGNHERAKDKVVWVLVGGALLLGSSRIVTALQAIVPR